MTMESDELIMKVDLSEMAALAAPEQDLCVVMLCFSQRPVILADSALLNGPRIFHRAQ